MDPLPLILAWLLVALLAGIAGGFGWLQVQTLRRSAGPEMSASDRSYFRAQAWRRLASCGLLGSIAVTIATAMFSGLMAEAAALGQTLSEERSLHGSVTLTPEQRRLGEAFVMTWGLVLLLLMAAVGIAAVDMLAIRSYGRRHLEAIRRERRAALTRSEAREGP